MHWESALVVAAEVGIGIAGFSSVFVAIARRSSDDWQPSQAVLLEVLLFASGAAIFASLLPFLLFEVGFSASSAWAVASAVYGLWLAGITVFRMRQGSRLGVTGLPRRAWAILLSSSVPALVLVNAAWFRTPWPYMLAVYWQLFGAFYCFILLLRSVSRVE